jgi:hypothetical protein
MDVGFLFEVGVAALLPKTVIVNDICFGLCDKNSNHHRFLLMGKILGQKKTATLSRSSFL